MPKATKVKSISQRLVVSWDERFKELKEYKDKKGDTNVPQKYKANPQLATWVKSQRQAYKKGKLSKERIGSLQGIGFSWGGGWDEMFGQLMVYNDEHKHCNVPRGYKDNPQLAIWVYNQRQAYKNQGTCKFTEERIKLLNGIGFEWECRKVVGWNERFEQLVQFKEEHEHCNVHRKHPQLGIWVMKQRQAKKKKGSNKISEEQIKLLNGIEFSWNPEEDRWNKRFEQLKGYKKDHGDCNISAKDKANQQLGK